MNKYIRIFKEACQKLEEDIGNPSVTQAIDYDMDNYEVDFYDDGLVKIDNILEKAENDLQHLAWNKYKGNKKLQKALDKLEDLRYYLFNEFCDKRPNNNKYVGKGFVDGFNKDDLMTWDIANKDNPQNK